MDLHPRLTAADREQVPLDEGTADPVAGTGTLAWVFDYDANGNPAKTQDPRTLDPNFGVVPSHGVLDRLESQTFTNHGRRLSCASQGARLPNVLLSQLVSPLPASSERWVRQGASLRGGPCWPLSGVRLTIKP